MSLSVRRRERALDVVAIVLPTIVVEALAWFELGRRSIWLDESASVTIAAQHGAALGAAMAHDGGNMLAFYALLHVLIGQFSNGVLVVRAPAAIATGVTVAVVCILARRLYDRRVALASGLITAVSLPLVYWGQDARAYALMIALVAASFLAFVLLSDASAAGYRIAWPWVAYVVVTTLALYMSFVAVLVVPAQLFVLVCYRRRLRAFLAAVALCALCAAPLAVLAERRGSGQLFWVPKPSLSALDQVVTSLSSAGFEPNFRRTSTSEALLWATVALLVLAALWAARGIARRRDGWPELPEVLLFAWIVVPVVLAWAESLVEQSVFLPRNLLVSLPPVGILIAAAAIGPRAVVGHREPALVQVGARSRSRSALGAIASLRAPVPARPRRWGWAIVGAFIALRALQLAPSYGVSPENWKGAVAYVLDRSAPGDCIAFYPSDGRMAFEYYLGPHGAESERAPRPVLPAAPWSVVTPYVEKYTTLSPTQLVRVRNECPRLWLVASHQGQQSGPSVSVENYRRYEALESNLSSVMVRRSSVAFGYAAPVDVGLYSRR